MDDKTAQHILHELSTHEKRKIAKQQKEEEREHKETEAEKKQKTKNYIWIGITLFVLVAFASGLGWLYTHKEETYTDREVHWHALIELSICGEKIELPCNIETDGTVHGQQFCGEHLMHHHYDQVLHIEGLIQKKEDIALGKFFDLIGVPFAEDTILDKKNGDLCPDGKPGVLKMYVNDKPRTDFREYIPLAVQDARKQIVKLVFESENTTQSS